MRQCGQLERELRHRAPGRLVVAQLAGQCQHGEDRHREGLVLAIAPKNGGSQRVGCDVAGGVTQPCLRSGDGRRHLAVAGGEIRQRGPDDCRGADVAAAAHRITPAAIRILVANEPARPGSHEGRKAIAAGVAVSSRGIEREHGGARRQRAARQMAVPMIGRGTTLEQAASKRVERSIELRNVEHRHDRFEAQVAERQERVVGVFAVHRIVGPRAEESAAVGPERIHEIEARLAQSGHRHVQRRERVQRRRGREEIRHWCIGRDAKKPPRAWQRSSNHMPASRSGGASRCRSTTTAAAVVGVSPDGSARMIAVTAIRSPASSAERIAARESAWGTAPLEVLIRVEGEKRAVRRCRVPLQPASSSRRRRCESLDAGEQAIDDGGRGHTVAASPTRERGTPGARSRARSRRRSLPG